jgi:hypothetical protein
MTERSQSITALPVWRALEAHDQRNRRRHVPELELGKVLAQRIVPELETMTEPAV